MTEEQVDVLVKWLDNPDLLIFWKDPRGGYKLLSGEVFDCGSEKIAYLSGYAHKQCIDLYNCGRGDILVTLKLNVNWPED